MLSSTVPTSFWHLADISLCCHGISVTSFFLSQQLKTSVGGISLCDGGKLEESEGYNYFFIVFYVLESK